MEQDRSQQGREEQPPREESIDRRQSAGRGDRDGGSAERERSNDLVVGGDPPPGPGRRRRRRHVESLQWLHAGFRRRVRALRVRAGLRAERLGDVEQRVHLVLRLDDGLQDGELHPPGRVLVHPGGNVLSGPAQEERVHHLVWDELGRLVVALAPPQAGHPVPKLEVDPGPRQCDVRLDGHHVDDEGLSFGAIDRVTARLVDEGEQVARHVYVPLIPTGFQGGPTDLGDHRGERWERLERPGEVPVALSARELQHGSAIPRHIDRDVVHRGEHRLNRPEIPARQGECVRHSAWHAGDRGPH